MELNDAIKAYIESAVSKIAEEKGLVKLSQDLTSLSDDFVEFQDKIIDRLDALERSESHDLGARLARLEYEIREVKLRH